MMKNIFNKIPFLEKLKAQNDALIHDNQSLKRDLHELNKRINDLKAEKQSYYEYVPPGHFHSPILSKKEVDEIHEIPLPESLPGIDLNPEKQIGLFRSFEKFYDELPFDDHATQGLRYYYQNPSYSYSDGIMLYCMIRHLKPGQIIEAGSGHSSSLILDTNQIYFNKSIRCTFIEPYPQLLYSLLKDEDRTYVKIIKSKLQDIPIGTFEKLTANDMLFIDSTHVSKHNSDVNYLIHEILPRLNSDVYIHIHDVFYPFEYPKAWFQEGRAWNEQYILRAFLEFNDQFEIVLFNTFLQHTFRDKLHQRFPLLYKNQGGSIWLKRK